MRVVGMGVLADFGKEHPKARARLEAWLAEAREAVWQSFHDVRERYASASYVKGHVIFNIGGNSYRLDTLINYEQSIVMIVRIGTHTEYDGWSLE